MTEWASVTASGSRVEGHRPWPSHAVDACGWRLAAEGLRDGRHTLLGYWGESDRVHLALGEPSLGGVCVLALECPDGVYPSVAELHAPAVRLERAIRDLHGLRATRTPNSRPWLDHSPGELYAFLPVEGEGLHQIPVGPVHAGVIEPGHFRFTAGGETVVRLEERLGYVHKGIQALMCGAPLDKAAKLAGRVSGDSTVAYAAAFARAVEAASGTEVPERAHWLRALMAELERVANHLGDIGAICNDAAFPLMLAHCGVLREGVLRTADSAFGHRLMMDRVVPGGAAYDLDREGERCIDALVADVRGRFPELIELYDRTNSLQDRTVGTGVLRPELAARFGCGGVIGRASGRTVDARLLPGYPPYDQLPFEVPVRHEGDVDARVWVRIREVQQSLSLIERILKRLPQGPIRTDIRLSDPPDRAEGSALVEGFRGDIFVWVRLAADGTVERCYPRDPSWFQWPLLEAVIEGNIVADFPLCNKSFNCSYSGHDI